MFAKTFRSANGTPRRFEVIPGTPGASFKIEAGKVGHGPWVGAVALVRLVENGGIELAHFRANGRVELTQHSIKPGIYEWRFYNTDSRQTFNLGVYELPVPQLPPVHEKAIKPIQRRA
jgi:hypothetical protein